jgi:hypothetical protein
LTCRYDVVLRLVAREGVVPAQRALAVPLERVHGVALPPRVERELVRAAGAFVAVAREVAVLIVLERRRAAAGRATVFGVLRGR